MSDAATNGEGSVNFASDNVTAMAPEILEALAAANKGPAMPYGEDALTAKLEQRLAELFEREVAVLPVATGTAANALGLASIVPPYGAIYCHQEAHVYENEAGAAEFYCGGARLVPLAGAHGKLTAETLAAAIPAAPDVHNARPAAISITQATEAGTLYQLDEIAAIAALAKARGLALQMDGARFANAVAALGCTPAEASWKAGVEVLSLGATKNGCMAAEALVFFEPKLAASTAERRKRGGHLFSKHRFLAAQLLAYFEGGLWLKNARHANAQARALAEGLAGLPEVTIHHAVQANLIFARLSKRLADALEAEGFGFYRWGDGAREVRLACAFNTKPEDVAAFVAAARRLSGARDAERAQA